MVSGVLLVFVSSVLVWLMFCVVSYVVVVFGVGMVIGYWW